MSHSKVLLKRSKTGLSWYFVNMNESCWTTLRTKDRTQAPRIKQNTMDQEAKTNSRNSEMNPFGFVTGSWELQQMHSSWRSALQTVTAVSRIVKEAPRRSGRARKCIEIWDQGCNFCLLTRDGKRIFFFSPSIYLRARTSSSRLFLAFEPSYSMRIIYFGT